jgi:hypothetical protein
VRRWIPGNLRLCGRRCLPRKWKSLAHSPPCSQPHARQQQGRAQLRHGCLHARHLPRTKPLHACIVAVVHEVGHGVGAGLTGAAVFGRRAAQGCIQLWGRVCGMRRREGLCVSSCLEANQWQHALPQRESNTCCSTPTVQPRAACPLVSLHSPATPSMLPLTLLQLPNMCSNEK